MLIFANGERIVEISGTEELTTNNRMELTAALKALQSLSQPSIVEIVTDSKYLQRGVVEWYERWSKNSWRTSDGDAIKNSDLWQALAWELKRHTIRWLWTKGHSKNQYNELADRLAGEARKKNGRIATGFDPQGVHLYPGVTWKKSTGSGAWAVILNYQNHFKILGDCLKDTTANSLYLNGVISAINSLTRVLPVYVHTRSGYLRDGLELWIDRWRKTNWCTRDGSQVSNSAQWQKLAIIKDKYSIKMVKFDNEQQLCHLQEAKELAREFEDFSSKC